MSWSRSLFVSLVAVRVDQVDRVVKLQYVVVRNVIVVVVFLPFLGAVPDHSARQKDRKTERQSYRETANGR